MAPQDSQVAARRAASAERQARLKARREAAGFRHSTVWIHTESEQAGFKIALQGRSPWPAPAAVVDLSSYFIGWVKGEEARLASPPGGATAAAE